MSKMARKPGRLSAEHESAEDTRARTLKALFLKTTAKKKVTSPAKVADVDTEYHVKLIAEKKSSGKKIEATSAAGYKKLLEDFS